MSLKWYPNAVLDEPQEAYGKTWRVDKIESDGTIVFRCGKETALAPRTDKEYFAGQVYKQVDFTVTGSLTAYFPYVPAQTFQSPGPVFTEKDLAECLKVMGDVGEPIYFGVHDEIAIEPKAFLRAMTLSPADIAVRNRQMLEGLPKEAQFTDRSIIWHRALTETEIRQAQCWMVKNWSQHYTLNCTLPRDGVEGMTVAEKMKGES